MVELTNQPTPTDNVAYAGWSRSTSPLTSGVAIHHPNGDVVKISTVTAPATVYTWPGLAANSHWAVTFSSGSNEPGSSGSPLFDQNHHVVGQDHGNQFNQCINPSTENCYCSYPQGQYGRFDVSWTGGGTSASRLMDWLDPNGTNAVSVNASLVPSITEVSSTCTSAVFQINNSPGPVTWSVGTTGLTISGSNTGTTVTVNGSTGGVLNATFTNCSTISQYIIIGKQPLTVNATVDRTPQSSHYQYLTATVTQLPGTTPSNYSWHLDVSGTPTTLIATGLTLNHYPIPPCQTIHYDCVANEPCGQVILNSYAYNTYCSGGSAPNDYIAYPNPANSTLTIAKTDTAADNITATTSSQQATLSYRVVLYDKRGKIVRSDHNRKNQRSISLDVLTLENDTYYLHIIEGGNVIEKQIIISR